MKKRLFISFGFIAVVLVSCNLFGPGRIKGNGVVMTIERSTDPIKGVKLKSAIDVEIVQGLDGPIRIEGEENIIPEIETELKGGILNIGYKSKRRISPTKPVIVYINAFEINVLKVAGSGSIISNGPLNNEKKIEIAVDGGGDMDLILNTPQLITRIEGSGNIKVSGQTEKSNLRISGSGDFKGSDLLSESTKVDIDGSGNAYVFASMVLDAKVTGSGDVRYKGNPKVNSNIKGSGEVRRQ